MMGAVTYPNDSVAEYVTRKFVALQVNYDVESELPRRYDVFWTPQVVFLDSRGREHYRVVGYLPPEVFIAYVAMARAKVAFGLHHYAEAAELFNEVSRGYPESEKAPESVYFSGVAKYKATEDDSHLDTAAEILEKLYPRSDWTLRAIPWESE